MTIRLYIVKQVEGEWDRVGKRYTQLPRDYESKGKGVYWFRITKCIIVDEVPSSSYIYVCAFRNIGSREVAKKEKRVLHAKTQLTITGLIANLLCLLLMRDN